MIRINYDTLGIAASIACAIHCAVLPLLLSTLPVLGVDIINNTLFEYLMILLALVVGVRALRHGYGRHHGVPYPMLLFSAGMALLLLKQFFHERQLYFLVPAMALIVTAHLWNFRLARRMGCNH